MVLRRFNKNEIRKTKIDKWHVLYANKEIWIPNGHFCLQIPHIKKMAVLSIFFLIEGWYGINVQRIVQNAQLLTGKCIMQC